MFQNFYNWSRNGHDSGVTFRMFQSLAKHQINIQVISTSEIKISVLIDKKNTKKALLALHKEFKLHK